MIYILSWITKKHLKSTFQATTFKVEENSRTSPKIQRLFNTVRTLGLSDRTLFYPQVVSRGEYTI